MPTKNGKSRKNRGNGGKRKQPAKQNNVVFDLALNGSGSTDHVVRSDFTYRPPSNIFRARVPRNLINQIHFIRQINNGVIQTSTSVITEINSTFSASGNMLQYSSYLSCFDQYMLHSVTYTVANASGGGLTGQFACPEVFTAIDFDNTAALGSVAAISAYGSVNQATLAPGESVTRYVEPCESTSLFVTVSTTAAGTTRMWIDSASNAVSLYGLRTIVNTTSSVVVLTQNFSLIWCFRNNI
jgi:hypothetical protein